jgi:hypothetical protein
MIIMQTCRSVAPGRDLNVEIPDLGRKVRAPKGFGAG